MRVPTFRSAVAVIILAVFALLGAACGSSGDEVADPAPPETTAAPAVSNAPAEPATTTTPPATSAPTTVAPPPAPEGACALVDDATIAALGVAEVLGAEQASVAGISNCLYSLDPAGQVQVISVPAVQWAQQIPAALDQLEGSGLLADPVTAAKFDEARALIAAGNADTPEGACALFSLMVELQGVGPGQTEVVNFVPSSDAPQAVNGQRCVGGQFTSVQLVTGGLVDDVDTYARVVAALDAIHLAGASG